MKLFRFREVKVEVEVEVEKGQTATRRKGSNRPSISRHFLCGKTVAMKDLSGKGHRAKTRVDKGPTRRSARLKVTKKKEET